MQKNFVHKAGTSVLVKSIHNFIYVRYTIIMTWDVCTFDFYDLSSLVCC